MLLLILLLLILLFKTLRGHRRTLELCGCSSVCLPQCPFVVECCNDATWWRCRQQHYHSKHAHRVFASTAACDRAAERLLLRMCSRNDLIGIPNGTNVGPIWGSDPGRRPRMTPPKKASEKLMKMIRWRPEMWVFPARQCDFQNRNRPTWERFEAATKPKIVKNQLVFVTFSEIDATLNIHAWWCPKTAHPNPLRRSHRKCKMAPKPEE